MWRGFDDPPSGPSIANLRPTIQLEIWDKLNPLLTTYLYINCHFFFLIFAHAYGFLHFAKMGLRWL